VLFHAPRGDAGMPKKSLAKYVNEIRNELRTKSSLKVASISDCAGIQAKSLKVCKPDATASGGQKRKRA